MRKCLSFMVAATMFFSMNLRADNYANSDPCCYEASDPCAASCGTSCGTKMCCGAIAVAALVGTIIAIAVTTDDPKSSNGHS